MDKELPDCTAEMTEIMSVPLRAAGNNNNKMHRVNTAHRASSISLQRECERLKAMYELEDRTVFPKRVPDHELRKIKKKSVRKFYKDQNELIDRFQLIRAFLERRAFNPQTGLLEIIVCRCDTDDEDEDVGHQPTASQDGHVRAPKNEHRPTKSQTGDGPDVLVGGNVPHQHLHSASDSTDALLASESSNSPRAILLINITFAINVILLAIKLFTTIGSGSLAVLASAVDSILDVVSGAIIFVTNRISREWSWTDWPTGKTRMEPLGIIIFAAVTSTSAFQIILQSIEKLNSSDHSPVDMTPVYIGLICGIIVIKSGLYIVSIRVTESPSVQALAVDHRNDVVFNTFTLLFALLAKYYVWWIDPVGAILLAFYIIRNWVSVLLETSRLLTGRAATTREHNELVYLALHFSSCVEAVDTVRAYHVGHKLFAEVDIVLPPDLPLARAHDIGEALQTTLEQLPNVERAFVHCDYESTHDVEHRFGVTSSSPSGNNGVP